MHPKEVLTPLPAIRASAWVHPIHLLGIPNPPPATAFFATSPLQYDRSQLFLALDVTFLVPPVLKFFHKLLQTLQTNSIDAPLVSHKLLPTPNTKLHRCYFLCSNSRKF